MTTVYTLSYTGPDPYVYGVYSTARYAYQALLYRYTDEPWKVVSIGPSHDDDRVELMNMETGEIAIWYIDEMEIDGCLPPNRYHTEE